jgi:hypothetical protein
MMIPSSKRSSGSSGCVPVLLRQCCAGADGCDVTSVCYAARRGCSVMSVAIDLATIHTFACCQDIS